MSVIGYFLFSVSSLFVIFDPIAAVPAFVAMTPRDSERSKLRTARLNAYPPIIPVEISKGPLQEMKQHHKLPNSPALRACPLCGRILAYWRLHKHIRSELEEART